MTPRKALQNIVDAWESLPGGKRYNLRRVELWLLVDMKPAIDAARKALEVS